MTVGRAKRWGWAAGPEGRTTLGATLTKAGVAAGIFGNAAE